MTRPSAPMRVRRTATQWESECRCCPLSAQGSYEFVLRHAVKHINSSATPTASGGTR